MFEQLIRQLYNPLVSIQTGVWAIVVQLVILNIVLIVQAWRRK